MAILFRRSNGIYYLVTSHNGHRVWRSTGARRRIDAEKYLRDFERQGEVSEEPKAQPQQLTFKQFIPEWRTYADTNFARSTIRLYYESIRNLLRVIGDRDLRGYSAKDMEKFKAARLKEVSTSKTNIDFRNVKALFNVAAKWGLLEKNPCSGVKLVKIPPQKPAYLTKEEFSRLIESIKVPWMRDVVAFAVSTMMRACEIVNPCVPSRNP